MCYIFIMNILDKISTYNRITIQCHDNPDPDAIASGFALYRYLTGRTHSEVSIVYSGMNSITKSNL